MLALGKPALLNLSMLLLFSLSVAPEPKHVLLRATVPCCFPLFPVTAAIRLVVEDSLGETLLGCRPLVGRRGAGVATIVLTWVVRGHFNRSVVVQVNFGLFLRAMQAYRDSFDEVDVSNDYTEGTV